MKRLAVFAYSLLFACGKPEEDSDLKAAFTASTLKDPSSVQFNNVAMNDEVICGEYNAKNGFGAYTGYDTFVFYRSTRQLWLADEGANPAPPDVFAKCPNATDLIERDLAQLERSMKRGE